MENGSGRDTSDRRSVGRNPMLGVNHQRARQEEQGRLLHRMKSQEALLPQRKRAHVKKELFGAGCLRARSLLASRLALTTGPDVPFWQ